MNVRNIVVVTAGLSQPSSTRLLADRLAEATSTALEATGEHGVVSTIELRDLAHAITDNLLLGFPSPALRTAIDSMVNADAIVAVTPIFSSSFSGLFKSFFDILDPGVLSGKPVALGATGGSARHSLALEYAIRPLFAYFKAAVVPTAVFAASEDWGAADLARADELQSRINRAAAELTAMVAVAAPTAAAVTPPESELVPFERMLAKLTG